MIDRPSQNYVSVPPCLSGETFTFFHRSIGNHFEHFQLLRAIWNCFGFTKIQILSKAGKGTQGWLKSGWGLTGPDSTYT